MSTDTRLPSTHRVASSSLTARPPTPGSPSWHVDAQGYRVYISPGSSATYVISLGQMYGDLQSASLERPSPIQFETIDKVCNVRGKQVWSFLSKCPWLIPIIVEAVARLQDYFPFVAKELYVSDDPEEPNSRQLVLAVVTPELPEEAIPLLDRFDEEWWLSVLPEAKGKLCITLSYV